MVKIKKIQPKKGCPKQYSAHSKNPLLIMYTRAQTGGRGEYIATLEMHCKDTRKTCCYVSREKECPDYPHDSLNSEPKKSGFRY